MLVYMFVLSCVQLCDTMDCSMQDSSVHVISRQEYWSGLPFSTPGGLLNPEIKPASPVSPALAGQFLTAEPPGKSLLRQKKN